ncbi:hypothetical protein [Ensifer adhaerens]|uniref:hypothetical protein n=1 Tax=Ensifer adhaerens TaxID=106592 RepID=UPI001C4DEC03|nr:hypothetical protein [Ensifer adhaerens]MBW0368399.1 hypothetical protein [Ensifer adhaerens]UCM24991.1 hypothetical protein LDL63_34970 [Ensifer adhaerens]
MEVARPKAVTSQKKPKRQRLARRGRRIGRLTVIATPEASGDLAALDEENRRLKGLLVQRLRQENTILKKMLERFETN